MGKHLVLMVGIIACLAASAEARLKLVALPERGKVVVRLDNPQATLVEEERVLTLQEGNNKIDFSWNGVQIDPDSIRFLVLSHPADVNLISVSYPPNENALVWDVYSPNAWEENVRISYLLFGIDRLVAYKGIADKKETKMDIKSEVVLRNFSGEDFNLAHVRLDYGEAFEKGIQHEETKKMLFFSKDGVPIKKVLTFDAAVLPWDPEKEEQNVGIPVTYVVQNDKPSGLGENALWDGKFRVFQDDGNQTTIFLGEDNARYTPVGKEIELFIGKSRDLVVTQRLMKNAQINIRRNKDDRIVLYDTDEQMDVKIENFKDKDQEIVMIERIPGQWDVEESTHEYEKLDAETLKFKIMVPAQKKIVLGYHYHRRNVR